LLWAANPLIFCRDFDLAIFYSKDIVGILIGLFSLVGILTFQLIGLF